MIIIKKFFVILWDLLSKLFDRNLLLLHIFILGLFLRELGVHPGNSLFHPDESSIVSQVTRIVTSFDFRAVDYYYGSLLSLIYSPIVLITIVPFLFVKFQFSNFFYQTNFNLRHELISYNPLNPNANYIYYGVRYETAFLSSLTIIAIYFLGKKLFNNKVGLVAAFLTAINYRHVLSSTFALADAPAALFAILSIYYSVDILKSQTTKTYLKAAFFLALAFSVKYFIYVLPTFILCHTAPILRQPFSLPMRIKNLLINKNLILSISLCIFLFFLINSYILLDHKGFGHQMQINSARYNLSDPILSMQRAFSGSALWTALNPLYYLYSYGIGKVIGVLILGGFCYGLFRYTKQTIIISSTTSFYLFVFLVVSGNDAVRNYSSIIPLLLLFPSLLITNVVTIIKKKRMQFFAIILLTLLIGYSSLKNSFILSYYLSKPQNLKQTLEWTLQNLSNKKDLILQTYDIPLSAIGYFNTVDINTWLNDKYLTLQEMRTSGINWAVIGSTYTSIRNNNLYISNKNASLKIFDEQTMWKIIDNTHLSLAIKQLGDYRIKEFTKPFWNLTTDTSFMIVKVPPTYLPKDKKTLILYDYEDKYQFKKFKLLSPLPCDYYFISYSEDQGLNVSGALTIESISWPPKSSCAIETIASSLFFSATSGRQYLLTGKLKKIGKLSDLHGDGFLRIDFYGADKKRLKTYVSKQMTNEDSWQQLDVEGQAPDLTSFVNVGFQIDGQYKDIKFFLDDLELFEANGVSINKTEYPYYGKEFPRSFVWNNQL